MAMKSELSCKIEKITPEIAAEWLEMNHGNFRRVDESRVANYAMEMAAGRWDLNGETIKFNGEVLMDGQHRLRAVIKSGKEISSFVVRGIKSDAMHIDRGKPRTVSQWLSHSKVKNAALVAAAARLVIGHDKGLWRVSAWGVSCMTDSEIIDYAITHQDALNGSIPPGGLGGCSASLFTAVLFIGSGRNDASKNDTATWFVNGLFKGSDLSETDAVLHLRNRLMDNTGSTRIGRFMMRALLTLAWNKTVLGEECGPNGLRIRLAGPGQQKAPAKVLEATENNGSL